MKTFVIAFLLALLTGCASSVTPHYDAQFGNTVREARLKMIINTDAGKNPDQVLGMDGKAARETIIFYQNTYKEPPAPVNVINIGGSR